MRSEKGQATVELALSLTVLFLILYGIIDFGRIYHAQLVLDHVGREAGRMASVGGTDSEIRQAATRAAEGIDSSRLSISISPSASSRTKGAYATINLTYSLRISTPLMAQIIPNPYPIKNKTVMRVE